MTSLKTKSQCTLLYSERFLDNSDIYLPCLEYAKIAIQVTSMLLYADNKEKNPSKANIMLPSSRSHKMRNVLIAYWKELF